MNRKLPVNVGRQGPYCLPKLPSDIMTLWPAFDEFPPRSLRSDWICVANGHVGRRDWDRQLRQWDRSGSLVPEESYQMQKKSFLSQRERPFPASWQCFRCGDCIKGHITRAIVQTLVQYADV